MLDPEMIMEEMDLVMDHELCPHCYQHVVTRLSDESVEARFDCPNCGWWASLAYSCDHQGERIDVKVSMMDKESSLLQANRRDERLGEKDTGGLSRPSLSFSPADANAMSDMKGNGS